MRKLIALFWAVLLVSLAAAQTTPPTGYVQPVAMTALRPDGSMGFGVMSSGGALYTNSSPGYPAGAQSPPSGFVQPMAPVAVDPSGKWQFLTVDANGNLQIVGGLPTPYGALGTCLVSAGPGITPVWGSCSGTPSSNWSSLVPGTGNITAGTYNVPTGATIAPTGTGTVTSNRTPTTGIVFPGSSSGTITVVAPAAAGANTITLPAGTGTVMLTNTSVLASQMPALTGECTTSAGAVSVTCGTGIAHTGVDINTSYQVTATHLAAALPINQGGTSATTASAAFTALAPTATVAGSVIYWNGTTWVKLDGNTSGTACLQENASGVPSWGACGAGGGVSSVALATNAGWFTISGSPVTSSGTLTFNLTAGQTANQVLATPDSTTGVVGLRALVANDIPSLNASKINAGVLATARVVSGYASETLRCLHVDGSNNITVTANDCGTGGFTAGGDLSGTSSSQSVIGIRSVSVPTLAAGYLHYTGAAFQWDTPSGSMVYPGAGIAVSTSSAWGTSIGYSAGAVTLPNGGSIGTADTGNPRLTYSSNLITSNVGFVAPTLLVGTSPASAGASAAGGFAATEAAATGWTPTAAEDYCRASSTAHGFVCSYNGDAESLLARASNNLGFFASTTSAQLASVLSNETGSGLVVFATAPQLDGAITLGTGASFLSTVTGNPGLNFYSNSLSSNSNFSLSTNAMTTTKFASTAGTTANLLACFDGTTGNVINCPTSATGALGVSMSTATLANPVEVATRGIVSCVADNSITVGNLVGVGTTTAGRCKDLGTTDSTTISLATEIVGKALSSASAGSTFNLQIYGPGHFGANPGAGSGTTLNINGAGVASTTNLNATTPAPPANSANVVWQYNSGSASAYIGAAGASLGLTKSGACSAGNHADGTYNADGTPHCSADTGSGGGGSPINAQTTDYPVVSGDFSSFKTITMTASVPRAITLLSSAPTNGQFVTIKNQGGAPLTIKPNGLTINGDARNIILSGGQSATVLSDGSNYITDPGTVFSPTDYHYVVLGQTNFCQMFVPLTSNGTNFDSGHIYTAAISGTPTFSWATPTDNYPCGVVNTMAASPNTTGFEVGQNFTATGAVQPRLDTSLFWEISCVAQASSASQVDWDCGYRDVGAFFSTNHVLVRGWPVNGGPDTNYTLVVKTAGSPVTVSMGVAIDTNPHSVRLYNDGTAGKVTAVLDGTVVKTACPSGCDLTATLPSTAMQPGSLTANGTGTNTFTIYKLAAMKRVARQ